MTQEELQKQIETEYDWFINEHGHKPNIAYVKCLWDGDTEPEEDTQIIAIDGEWYDAIAAENGDEYVVPYIKDEDVLFYCTNVESLIDITKQNAATDFIVVEFDGFDYYDEN